MKTEKTIIRIIQVLQKSLWREKCLYLSQPSPEIIQVIQKFPCLPPINFIIRQPPTKPLEFIQSIPPGMPLIMEPRFITLDDVNRLSSVLKERQNWIIYCPVRLSCLTQSFVFASFMYPPNSIIIYKREPQ